MNDLPRPTWMDMTLRVAEDAEIELERQPNGDIEYTIPVPECPSSRITFVVPAAVARKVNESVRELIGVASAIALAFIA